MKPLQTQKELNAVPCSCEATMSLIVALLPYYCRITHAHNQITEIYIALAIISYSNSYHRDLYSVHVYNCTWGKAVIF